MKPATIMASLNHTLGGLAQIALHEWRALQGHFGAALERFRVARRARGPGEMMRDQLDLLPESRNRWRRDRAQRRELWRGLVGALGGRRRA